MTTVTLPVGITSIGDWAFGLTALTSVTIPEGITSIPYCAFYGCSALASVTLPNSLTSIGNHAFDDCTALPSVTIPKNIDSIGEGAFLGCSRLATVFLPVKNAVAALSDSVFSDASSLYILDGTGSEANRTAYTNAANWSTYAARIFFAYQKTFAVAGASSLYLLYDVTVPEGVKAYYCRNTDKKTYLSVVQLPDAAPACTPLYLVAAAGTYNFLGNNNGVQKSLPADINTILKGGITDLTNDGKTYLTLDKNGDSATYGFYPDTSTGNIKANTCYILADECTEDVSFKGLDVTIDNTPVCSRFIFHTSHLAGLKPRCADTTCRRMISFRS